MKLLTTIHLGLVIILLVSCGDDGTTPVKDTVKDVQGNVYKTIKIGDQEWMAENLRVSSFCNGTHIANRMIERDGLTPEEIWTYHPTEPALCYYNDDAQVATEYGYLYNWLAVNDNQCLCPEGWRVPTEIDWQLLMDFLGPTAGVKLKEQGYDHWIPSGDALNGGTNESGFTAIPGALRHHNTFSHKEYFDTGYIGSWWASDDSNCFGFGDDEHGLSLVLEYDSPVAYIDCALKATGRSVRCIKK